MRRLRSRIAVASRRTAEPGTRGSTATARPTRTRCRKTVSIPSTCTNANLSFWLHIDTAETTTTTKYDTLKVQVLNSSGTVLGTLATYSNLDHNSGYALRSFSLAPYIGQTVTLEFTGSEDFELQTSFVIDDTAINVS
jgi:hypothetical protein